MKAAGEARSPFNLQGALFREAEKLTQIGVGRAAVRKILKTALSGWGFAISEGRKNDIPYFVRQRPRQTLSTWCVCCGLCLRVSQVVPLTSDHAPKLAELLFEGRFKEATSMVRQVISGLRGFPTATSEAEIAESS